jgi:predicted Ser/Thr protein kinase
MAQDPDLEARLSAFVEHHVLQGERLPLEPLCEGRPDLLGPLRALVETYLSLSSTLDAAPADLVSTATLAPALPQFDGFRTIERLGAGGMGEVYKLQDLALDRLVAAKVVRHDRPAQIGTFLDEARALALFQDRRIVQLFEFRADADPPVIIMEFVDGFELQAIAPSLEYRQRARIVEQVAEAIHRAHGLGIQHRDLKPSNIMLDAALSPKILDFGLSASHPDQGHLRGTLPYLAPEQLDPSQPIDARTDVYALGVILYEILCGAVPFAGADQAETIEAIRRAQPRLPAETEPSVPEPLQAVALKAMERDPALRYQTALELAQDLRRFLDGRPVIGRPAVYASALGARVREHMDHVAEWLRLRLIYPHEAADLRSAYRHLEAREDDWIVSARALTYSQIALYLGAFLLVAGSLFYFGAYYQLKKISGLWGGPFVVLGLPFVGLNLVARHLYTREHRAVAVAFYLGGVGLLPIFLVILLREMRILQVPSGMPGQFFENAYLSNQQLQVTVLAACLWAGFLALRTKTVALSTVFAALLFLLTLAVLTDFGLRDWADNLKYDQLALHLMPLVLVYGVLGYALERTRRPWFGRPLYVGSALVIVLALELLAQDGKEFALLGGLSMNALRGGTGDVKTLNTLAAMTLNGVAMYTIALVLEGRGSDLMKPAGGLLFTLSPFAALKPLGLACMGVLGHYSYNYDWIYLGLSLGSCLLAHARQRRSFYYAGLLNTGSALYFITDHQKWFDKPWWADALVAGGLAILAGGFALAVYERSRVRTQD